MAESVQADSRPRATLAVLTFRRELQIAELLPQLIDQAAASNSVADVSIMVVDNDPQGSAAAAVHEFLNTGQGTINYLHQPSPGIATSRNRALDAALLAGDDWLVFIDDDETPGSGWLPQLLSTQLQSRQCGVLGPVIARYQTEPGPFILAGGFFVRPRWETGHELAVGYSSNILINLHSVRAQRLRFDDSLGMRGGEDTLFTRRLTSAGARFVWNDEAIVFDNVPAERLTRAWVLQRRYSFGTLRSLIALKLEPTGTRRALRRIALISQGTIRMAGGCARYLLGRTTGSIEHEARGARTFQQGRGLLVGAFGRAYAEYSRT
ncbi:MAG: glycosyltransferase family 2 protein [Candidatus Nanopelagicales bacterium]